jgi:hypothetical protein
MPSSLDQAWRVRLFLRRWPAQECGLLSSRENMWVEPASMRDGGRRQPALRDGGFAHPTIAESLNNLFTAMDSKK